jgi:hypothetical protein
MTVLLADIQQHEGSSYIGNKEKAGTGGDTDAAAAYYNRSCYQALKAMSLPEATRQPLRTAAIADFQEAVKRSPQYQTDAKTDTDLDAIRGAIADNG